MRHPAYHLRTNKAVDRLLLVDVLRCLKPNHQLTYYSLAGPFLEDLRVMDHFFPEMKLVSLEKDKETFKRQQFHKFNSHITLERKKISEYLVNGYQPGDIDIFWLDYTGLEYTDIQEFQHALTIVPLGSIVRITMRAEPELDLDRLKSYLLEEEIERLQAKIEKDFQAEFSTLLPTPSPGAFAGYNKFPEMVALMVRQAASLAVDTAGSDRDFLLIQSTYYNDSTQMVSVTGIVCQRDKVEETKDQFRKVRFCNFDWLKPDEINIPALSVKERLKLEDGLPVDQGNVGSALAEVLGYKIDRTHASSQRQLEHYANHHRYYPNFVRITI